MGGWDALNNMAIRRADKKNRKLLEEQRIIAANQARQNAYSQEVMVWHMARQTQLLEIIAAAVTSKGETR